MQQRELHGASQHQSETPTKPMSPAAVGSPTEATEVIQPSSSHSVEPVSVQNPVPVHNISNQGGQGHSAFRPIKESSILTPTPITSTVSGSTLHTGSGSGSALRNIDLKDFETEQDPFENLSLRVINDREELNKVFYGASVPSQQAPSAVPGMTTSSAATKPNHAINSENPSLLQYSAGNIANGLNTASLNWIKCQPVPRWPFTNDNMSNSYSPTVRPQQAPYQVSGPFADHSNVPQPGATYFRPSDVQPLQQSATMPVLRSAKSTPDISKLLNEHEVPSARRTPPPVSSDWSTVLDSQNRDKVRSLFCDFLLC